MCVRSHPPGQGLLTIVFARGPGLELQTPAGWQPLAHDGALVVLAGATLEAATGGAVRTAVHRVVPQNAPRCSVVMRVRGLPTAQLPGTPSATVASFEARFRATHDSINAPRAPDSFVDLVGEYDLGSDGRDSVIAPPPTCSDDASPAERAFGIPAIASLIVGFLAITDQADAGYEYCVILARAELVCRALRAAVAPCWAAACAKLQSCGKLPNLPAALLPGGHVTQWKRLYHSTVRCIQICIKDLDGAQMNFRVDRYMDINFVFNAYCDEKQVHRDKVRFLLCGNRCDFRGCTPYALDLEHGDSIEAFMEQCGD